MTKYELMKQEYLNNHISIYELANKYKACRGSFARWMRKQGYDIQRLDKSIDVFEEINSEETAYWLGFMYADGNVFKRSENNIAVELTLAEKDLEHVQKFSDFLGTGLVPKYREKTKAYRISLANGKLGKDLIKLGCVPAKSLILKWPTYEQVPSQYMKHFARGYFDGDGCISLISTDTSAYSISILGTKEFLESLLEEFQMTGQILKKDKRHLSNTYYIRFARTTGLHFLNLVYSNANIYLERKMDRFNLIVKRTLTSKIKTQNFYK